MSSSATRHQWRALLGAISGERAPECASARELGYLLFLILPYFRMHHEIFTLDVHRTHDINPLQIRTWPPLMRM